LLIEKFLTISVRENYFVQNGHFLDNFKKSRRFAFFFIFFISKKKYFLNHKWFEYVIWKYNYALNDFLTRNDKKSSFLVIFVVNIILGKKHKIIKNNIIYIKKNGKIFL